MEKCKLCGEELYNGKYLSPIIDGDNSKGSVHQACRNTAISLAIIEKEAERAKVPTLDEQILKMMIGLGYNIHQSTAERLIAMVSENDATAHPVEVESAVIKLLSVDRNNWRARAEKAEAALYDIASTAQAASKREG